MANGKPGRPKEFEVRVSSSVTQDTWDVLERMAAKRGLAGAAPTVRFALEEFVRAQQAEEQAVPAA